MSILKNIQDMINQGLPGFGAPPPQGQSQPGIPTSQTQGEGWQNRLSQMFGSNSGLLGPAALGGLVGALLSSRAARGVTGGALLAGGGAALWNKYKERIRQEQAGNPQFGHGETPPDERAQRLVRALVYAAKSDGHIDAAEQRAIREKLSQLNIGSDAEQLVQQAINEPLDPDRIAGGVKNEEEALELYTLSRAVIQGNQFMERSYLEGLAAALKIPDDVRTDLDARLSAQG